jgi:hypothetical protein
VKRTTVFTCSIYPDLTRVWHHFVRRYTDADEVEVVVYDCGSRLRPEHFPGARIVRHANTDHGRKIDHCVRETVRTPLLFLTDDDAFVVSDEAEPMAASALLGDERAAAWSFKPRGWWELDVDGERHPVMGSYSLVFKPDLIRRERLSFRTRPTDDPRIRNGGGYYDTADYANEQLLRRNYAVLVPDEETRRRMVLSYSAVSSGFVNFARRGWLTGEYRLTKPRDAWAARLRTDARALEWACGVAGTISLHRKLFDEPPRFGEFFSYDDLDELAERADGASDRQNAIATVAGYRNLLATLEASS